MPNQRVYPVHWVPMRYLATLAGIAATAVLFVLALPIGEQAYLAWFCATPLLLVTRDRGFLYGCLCALASLGLAAMLVIWWPFHPHRDPLGDPAMVVAGFGQFGVSLGLTTSIWADATLNRRPAWWFGGLATLAEASLLLTLPANLALTQYRQPVPLLLASVGGIWLVSFLLYWANFGLALAPRNWIAPAAALLAVLSFGLSGLPVHASGNVQRFAAIQIVEPDETDLDRLQRDASVWSPRFVVWPELSGAAMVRGDDSSALRRLSGEDQVAPFVTSFEDGCKPLPHNVSAIFISGRESVRYAKRRMFGSEGSIHLPGNHAVAVDYSGGRVGLAICFDSCYPEVIRDSARLPGVNVIALPTIDPFGSDNFLAAVHAAYSPFRCAEEGVAMVRADGRAYSQVVDPFGRIVAESPPGNHVLFGAVSTSTHWTFYKQFGDWFLWLCGGLFLLGCLRYRREARNPKGTAAQDKKNHDQRFGNGRAFSNAKCSGNLERLRGRSQRHLIR